jgi:hypothetical protein
VTSEDWLLIFGVFGIAVTTVYWWTERRAGR